MHDWLVNEILGEPLEAQRQTAVPDIPVIDDPLRNEQPTVKAARLSAEKQAEEWLEDMIGPREDIAAAQLAPWPKPQAPIASFDNFLKNTIRFTDRARSLDADGPRRRSELRDLFTEQLSALHPHPEDVWHLADAAERALRGILMEA
jgi:hypothetical protein